MTIKAGRTLPEKALAKQWFYGDGDQQLRLPLRQRLLCQLTCRLVKWMVCAFDENRQEARRPRQQMPGQQLFAFAMTAIFRKPGSLQQQGTKMIFRFILLDLKLDAVVPHPLA